MALITVNSVALPNPSELKFSFYDITNSYRTVDGLAHTEFIAQKRKINVKYSFVSQADVTTIIGALKLSTFYFPVSFFNPETGSQTTGSFYVGDRDIGMFKYDNDTDEAWYEGFSFALIEQ